MPFTAGIAFVATGLAILLFGLFLFYAFLPVLFAFIGFDIGLLLGRWLTGDVGWPAIALGIAVAAFLAGASYALEPYRRLLFGASSGFLAGLSLAAALGVDGWFGSALNILLAFAGGMIGGFLVLYLFDVAVIVASALGGASLVMVGVHLFLRGVGLFDHIGDRLWSSIVVLALAFLGIVWQFRNISKWAEFLPIHPSGLGPAAEDRKTPPRT